MENMNEMVQETLTNKWTQVRKKTGLTGPVL